ncbi:MAG: hypothetical protein U5K72_20020 [Balneolaceae bacterium]|nr:hypothetical protein [Balneolaceae bacterium]
MKSETTLKNLSPEATLNQIISADEDTPQLLQSIGLNPNVDTEKTLRQVCFEKQWNEAELLNWIKKNRSSNTAIQNNGSKQKKKLPDFTSITEITEYLTSESLSTVSDLSSQIQNNYKRVSQVHGIQYPWLKEAEWHVFQLINTLSFYKKFETETFYPLAGELQKQKERMLDGNVQNLKRSMDVVKEDHKQMKKSLQRIKKMSGDFHFDESACSTLRILCNRLQSLHRTLSDHLKIEQEKLLPKIETKLENS